MYVQQISTRTTYSNTKSNEHTELSMKGQTLHDTAYGYIRTCNSYTSTESHAKKTKNITITFSVTFMKYVLLLLRFLLNWAIH